MENEILNAAVDNVPEIIRDYEVMGTAKATTLPSKVSLNVTPLFDQYAQSTTHYACTVVGETHTKHDQEKKATLDPVVEWEDAIIRGAIRDFGRSLGEALQMYMDKGYISGYARVRTLQAMKEAIASGKPLYTGSSKIDWKKTKASKDKVIVKIAKGAGHAFSFCGYDDDRQALEAKNSNASFPTFWVPYTDLDVLFSVIVLFTKSPEDVAIVEDHKARDGYNLIQLAVEKKLTNGQDLDTLVLRSHLVTMIGRAAYGIKKDEELLELCRTNGIRNGKNWTQLATRWEVMLMLWRYALGEKSKTLKDNQTIDNVIKLWISNGSRQEDYCTRAEAIIMVARAYLVKNT